MDAEALIAESRTLIGGKKPLQDKFDLPPQLFPELTGLPGDNLDRSIPRDMASRRLALNFNQALRSRAALKSLQPIKRGFATPIHHGINTESTTLSNGLTVSML